jgi:serine phosphatase RsbU (regulator of sigma subunit)/anti-sigma regulatory factor (Ser/Thr protein kinase)
MAEPSAAPQPSPRRLAARLLAPSIWLSHRLSFTRKYGLISVVVVLALAALSAPLWQQVRRDRALAELERRGLHRVAGMAPLLSALVRQRDAVAQAGPPADHAAELADLAQVIAGLDAPAPTAAAVAQLRSRWQQLREQPADAPAPSRFAAHNGVILAALALTQAEAQAHRLSIDPELDASLALLSARLPQLLDTLGKQQVAVRLDTGDLTPYALGAQVFLTESVPMLRQGLAQLLAARPAAQPLQGDLDALLAGIARQQDAADRTLDTPQAWEELSALAAANEALTLRFIDGVTRAADAQLGERIDDLVRSQWVIGGLLVGALAAIGYLFMGIYASTLQSLRRLSDGTADFCAGQLGTRIRLDTQDELVAVAGNFNTVAEQVGRLLEVIREQNESRERELETQVQARTAELAEKNEQLGQAARRVQEELALARDMQQAILPQDFPDEPGWAVHASMIPARELGGDFYDVYRLPDGRCGVLVADVSGKGAAAAFFMAVSRTVLLDLASTGLSPARVLARANDLLCQRNPMDMFVTVCCAVFDPRDGTLVYASAGHPAPLRRDRQGAVQALPVEHDMALAVLPELSYTDRHTRLEAGDALLLYSDGITEAFSPAHEAYGDPRLLGWLAGSPPTATAAQQVAALVDDVHRHVAEAEASDDITALILSRKLGDPTMTDPSPSVPILLFDKRLLLDHHLASRLEAIAVLAQAVDDALPERPDLAFSANLCLEELITNIIVHGLKGRSDRDIHVRMSMSPEWLEIVLKDDAPPFDPFSQAPPPDLDAEVEDRAIGGLGVHLVKQLMDDARAYYDGSGNLIVLLKTLRRQDSDT